MRIEYHRTLLADRVRNAAFHAALARVIVKGETTVADIGAGTGFLGFLAAKLGARRVDIYETADIAAVARKLLRHNKLANCRIAEVHSTDVASPEPVDVIVCETLGNYPFEENIVETLNDARERFLNARRRDHSARGGAVRLPRGGRALLSRAGGLGRGRLRPRFRARQDDVASTTSTCARSRRATCWSGAAAARSWDKLAFDRRNKTTRAGEASWAVKKRTAVYGLALWWSAELADGVSLSTGPLDPRTHWEQLYLPALAPIALEAGQTLAVRLRSTTSYERGTNVTWTLSVRDASGRDLSRQSLDLEKGFLP